MRKPIIVILLIGLAMPCFSQNSFGSTAGGAWDDNWLYIGVRLGGSVHFYQLGDCDIKNHSSFDFAIQLSMPLLKNFGIQTELLYSTEEAVFSDEVTVRINDYYGYTTYPGTIVINAKYSEFMIPVLLKYKYEFGIFNIAGLFGPFFTIPLGRLEYTEELTYSGISLGEYKDNFDVEDIFGVMLGLNFGMKLGPGTMFLDIRYAVDNDSIKIDGDRLVHRNFLPVSIGYELGLLPKKR
jgi:hypothetical protein